MIAECHKLDLLATTSPYSTCSEWNDDSYQNGDVSIRSSIVSILSDLLPAKFDRNLKEQLNCDEGMRIFRFVDNYLVVFKEALQRFFVCILQN